MWTIIYSNCEIIAIYTQIKSRRCKIITICLSACAITKLSTSVKFHRTRAFALIILCNNWLEFNWFLQPTRALLSHPLDDSTIDGNSRGCHTSSSHTNNLKGNKRWRNVRLMFELGMGRVESILDNTFSILQCISSDFMWMAFKHEIVSQMKLV